MGCKTFLKLLQTLSPTEIFSSQAQTLQQLGLKPYSIEAIKAPDWGLIDQDLLWSECSNHHILSINDTQYPSLLKQISAPPPLLFVNGNPEVLKHPQIAIVGSRNPSDIGQQIATDFAATLASQGFAITSGLALGIDVASHQGALKVAGFTVAVAGTGPDRIYPARHQQLARDITEQGAIVSEFPLGTPAKANHFPQRNRIISGLSIGLLVVEAAQKSGSLITARCAIEQNREVFAIPGSIQNPLARGCNGLIRDGAKLVETTHDILVELKPLVTELLTATTPAPIQAPSEQQLALLNSVQYSPTSIDTLVQTTGNSVEVISSMLLVLELQGFITLVAGGYYIRIK